MGLQEILVTATKRLEDIQEVPLSITALSAGQLEAKGVESFFDYGTSVPNLSFGLGAADGSLAARGVALRGVQGANTTGFYIDDIPVVETLDPHIVDVARIEVLRGPQGTLYGAQSMGGTIRIITEQPSAAALSGQAHANASDTEHGSWNELVEGDVNVPLIGDELAVRASGYYQFDSGWFTKWLGPEALPPKSVETDVGSVRYYGGQLALRYEPVAGFDITPRIMYQRTDQDGAQYAAYSPSNLLQREVFNLPEGGTDEWWLASLALNYAARFGTFVSSTAVFDRTTSENEDDTDVLTYDLGLPASASIPGVTARLISLHRFSQEVRFASSLIGPLQFIVGGFYSRTTQGRNYQITSSGLTAATGFPSDLVYALITERQNSEYAAFGDLSYNLLSTLTATVGLRGYRDTATYSQFTNGLFYGGAPQNHAAPPTSDSGVVPRYVLEWKVKPEVLSYVSASKGFREGGDNPAVPIGPPPKGCSTDLADIGLTPAAASSFRSDSLWSYDVGVKSGFFDRRLTMNMAGFVIEWDNIQQPVSLPQCGYTITGNSGRAQSSGFEFELNARPLSQLTFGLGVGYEHARITEKGAGSPQAAGSAVYQVPTVTLNSNVEYQRRLNAHWTGFTRIDYSYIGESFSGNNEQFHPVRRPPYEIGDLRLGVRSDRYELATFVKNLFNERANLGDAILIGAQLPGQPRFLINQPRTVGVQVRARFE
ncbi:MAG: TonB-dependent receptor [Gammaproteobacteria bacterium]|nr:TonB-dependent receptor [Gammaproteobacteria bacterium]